jgi:peptidoglycan/xylan/chitin deacetylase (PgdA/CDA1 family)
MLQYSFRLGAPPVPAPTAVSPAEWVPYSAIIDRPRLRWKDGKRLAVWICPCVLHYEYLPPPDPWLNGWARMEAPDAMGYARQEYGMRVGFWRVLEVLDRLRIRATAIANTDALERYPSVAAAIRERSWDVVGHGESNTRFVYGMNAVDEGAVYERMLESVFRTTGVRMKGTGGPGPQAATENTADLLAEAGFTFFTDLFLDEQPVAMRVRTGALVAMPYSVEVNDSPVLGSAHEADHFRDIVKAQFDTLYEDSRESGRVMCISIHPVLFGQPHRIRYLAQALEHVVSHDDVWLATGAEIADWFMAHHLQQPGVRP